MISAHLDWVRDHSSREETIELFAALPAEVRQQVSTVLPTAWYDFATLIALDRSILGCFGEHDIRFLEQIGAYSAQKNLSGIDHFFRRDSMHEFFRRVANLSRQFQDFGVVEYVEVATFTGMIRHRADPVYSPLHCASAMGFYRECVTLHGGTQVLAMEMECQCAGEASCTFAIDWR